MRDFIYKYILDIVLGLAVAIMGWVYRRTKKKFMKVINEHNNLNDGVQALLRAELIRSGEKYVERGYAPIYAKDAYDKAYVAYHNLGGNGTMTDLHERVTNLPNKKGD